MPVKPPFLEFAEAGLCRLRMGHAKNACVDAPCEDRHARTLMLTSDGADLAAAIEDFLYLHPRKGIMG